MSDGTKIEWTDATWNVVNGCSVYSPGCTNCYAMRLAGTRLKHHPSREGLTIDTKAGPVWNGNLSFNEKVLEQPLHWRRPRKIFVCAHGDLFHDDVPDEWIDRVFTIMGLCPQHQFQVLTKRAERMRYYLTGDLVHVRAGIAANSIRMGKGDPRPVEWPLPNVWIGVSVEDQTRADERIPYLLDTPAALRWLSCEPLLGPVDLGRWMWAVHHHPDNTNRNDPAMYALLKAARDRMGGGIDWVVAGGESGRGARPMHPDWARQLRDACAAAGVPFLFKQWGAWSPDNGDAGLDRVIKVPARAWSNGRWHDQPRLICEREIGEDDVYRLGKKTGGRCLDGVQHDGYPA